MLGAAPLVVLGICCVLVLFASLVGGWLPLLVRLTHARLQIAISFVAGLMLGLALLHFIPDANEELHSMDRTVAWALAGFLVMFFLQRFFHYHTHEVPGEEGAAAHKRQHSRPGHEPDHGHVHNHVHVHAGKPAGRLSWVGAAFGLTLHSLLDGIALAAAVSIGSRSEGTLIGLGTALAVILHKPFDAMAISTLMAAGGQSRKARHWMNVLYAFVTPLGVLGFYLGLSELAESNVTVLGCALGFCAGTFLCISCSDLLPELQFHSHDRIWLSLALLGGLAVAIAILFAETGGPDQHSHTRKAPLGWQSAADSMPLHGDAWKPSQTCLIPGPLQPSAILNSPQSGPMSESGGVQKPGGWMVGCWEAVICLGFSSNLEPNLLP